MEKQDYFLGLDMGTSSVGWAVTNIKYELLRKKGKDMWGIREFDEANSAAERRTNRVNRRRRQRQALLDIDDTGEKFDVRLVYLALANMFKHRGHFLLNAEGDALNTEQVDIVYQEILDSLENDYEIIIEVQKLTCSSEKLQH